jgi:hypothetical protein
MSPERVVRPTVVVVISWEHRSSQGLTGTGFFGGSQGIPLLNSWSFFASIQHWLWGASKAKIQGHLHLYHFSSALAKKSKLQFSFPFS